LTADSDEVVKKGYEDALQKQDLVVSKILRQDISKYRLALKFYHFSRVD